MASSCIPMTTIDCRNDSMSSPAPEASFCSGPVSRYSSRSRGSDARERSVSVPLFGTAARAFVSMLISL